jgi:hypothetical protein
MSVWVIEQDLGFLVMVHSGWFGSARHLIPRDGHSVEPVSRAFIHLYLVINPVPHAPGRMHPNYVDVCMSTRLCTIHMCGAFILSGQSKQNSTT